MFKFLLFDANRWPFLAKLAMFMGKKMARGEWGARAPYWLHMEVGQVGETLSTSRTIHKRLTGCTIHVHVNPSMRIFDAIRSSILVRVRTCVGRKRAKEHQASRHRPCRLSACVDSLKVVSSKYSRLRPGITRHELAGNDQSPPLRRAGDRYQTISRQLSNPSRTIKPHERVSFHFFFAKLLPLSKFSSTHFFPKASPSISGRCFRSNSFIRSNFTKSFSAMSWFHEKAPVEVQRYDFRIFRSCRLFRLLFNWLSFYVISNLSADLLFVSSSPFFPNRSMCEKKITVETNDSLGNELNRLFQQNRKSSTVFANLVRSIATRMLSFSQLSRLICMVMATYRQFSLSDRERKKK